MDPEGGKGAQTPLKDHNKIGFLSNTGPDPLKNRKATRLEFNIRPSFGRQRNAKWRFTSGPMMARFKWYFDHLSSHHQLKKKNVDKVGHPLTKVSGSTHDWDVKYHIK